MTRRASACASGALALYAASCLALDLFVGLDGQLAIGVLTCVVLVAAGALLPPARRVEIALVVVVATFAELTGPSGAAAGYLLLDAVALALAPRLLAALTARRPVPAITLP